MRLTRKAQQHERRKKKRQRKTNAMITFSSWRMHEVNVEIETILFFYVKNTSHKNLVSRKIYNNIINIKQPVVRS